MNPDYRDVCWYEARETAVSDGTLGGFVDPPAGTNATTHFSYLRLEDGSLDTDLINKVANDQVYFYFEPIHGTVWYMMIDHVDDRLTLRQTNYMPDDHVDEIIVWIENERFSIPSTVWFSLVTMTTVGYGEEIPQNSVSMFIAVAAMLCGIVMLSLPVAVLGNNFQELEHLAPDTVFIRKSKRLSVKRNGDRGYTHCQRADKYVRRGYDPPSNSISIRFHAITNNSSAKNLTHSYFNTLSFFPVLR
jgi:hypothetical protein